MDWQATRPGETSANLPDRQDAHLVFIGRLRTPFATRDQCPRQGDAEAGPVCRAEIDEPWRAALAGIETFRTIRKGQFVSCRTGVENEIDFVAKLFPEAA